MRAAHFTMDDDEPLVWRVPPWQAAVALLIAAAAAAYAIYGGAFFPRVLCVVVAVISAFGGLVAARAYLVVDPEGIGWRRISGEVSIPWADVERVSVETTRKGPLLRVWRHSMGVMTVPPTLVLPSRPVTNTEAVRRLNVIAHRIQDYGEPHRR